MNYDNEHDRCANLDDAQDSDFTRLVDAAMSRRSFLGTTAAGMAAFS